MYLTALDIWQRGTIYSDRFDRLANELALRSGKEHTTYWEDVFAIGKDGHAYPKHCILMSLLAAPFVGLLGQFGAWLFSTIIILATMTSLYRLSERLYAPCSGMLLITLLLVGSQFVNYMYQFDPDVLCAALIICGLDLTFSFPLMGSFVLGLSIFTRPFYLVLAPILLAPALLRANSNLIKTELCLGLSLGLSLCLMANYVLWGAPLTFQHHRVVVFTNGIPIFTTKWASFSFEIFFSSWFSQLFDTNVGIILYNPVLLLLPVLMMNILRDSTVRYLALPVVLFFLAQAILIFTYPGWAITPSGGNRYLLPALLLISMAISASITPTWNKLTHRT